jgi:hypothetical protein
VPTRPWASLAARTRFVRRGTAAEAKSPATDLKRSLGQPTDPALKELVIKDGAKLITEHTTLADDAVIDPRRLQAEHHLQPARRTRSEWPCVVDDCLDRRESKIRFEMLFPGASQPYWTRYRVDDGTTRWPASRKRRQERALQSTELE